eukprot:361176-Chlamydomonas_euryale.AAC.4
MLCYWLSAPRGVCCHRVRAPVGVRRWRSAECHHRQQATRLDILVEARSGDCAVVPLGPPPVRDAVAAASRQSPPAPAGQRHSAHIDDIHTSPRARLSLRGPQHGKSCADRCRCG